ncbi:hypothetical protein V2J09_020904 [Rumex salicifolius]
MKTALLGLYCNYCLFWFVIVVPAKHLTWRPSSCEGEVDSALSENLVDASLSHVILLTESVPESEALKKAKSLNWNKYIDIDLQDIRNEVQCPICLGIIKQTRTVMECLHRFCRQCIDKSMRMGNNECPACRTHCASRRSLRDDPKYDAFIAALFPDLGKYEKEELAFCEEEQTRNKQIQESIAQVVKLQSEAVVKKRSSRKGTGVTSPSRSRRNNRYTPSRRSKRKRSGKTVLEDSDDYEDLENAEGQTSSYSGEHLKEIDQSRHKTRRQSGTSWPISPATSSDTENNSDQKRLHPAILWNMEMRAWSKGGPRSYIRHGSANSLFRKNPPSTHLAKLAGFLQNLDKKDDEYVDSETPLGADKQLIEVNEPPGSHYRQDSHQIEEDKGSEAVDQFRARLQMSEEKTTLVGFEENCIIYGSSKLDSELIESWRAKCKIDQQPWLPVEEEVEFFHPLQSGTLEAWPSVRFEEAGSSVRLDEASTGCYSCEENINNL